MLKVLLFIAAVHPQSLPVNEQALWWACYAARHGLTPGIILQEKLKATGLIRNDKEMQDFIGLCYGA